MSDIVMANEFSEVYHKTEDQALTLCNRDCSEWLIFDDAKAENLRYCSRCESAEQEREQENGMGKVSIKGQLSTESEKHSGQGEKIRATGTRV